MEEKRSWGTRGGREREREKEMGWGKREENVYWGKY